MFGRLVVAATLALSPSFLQQMSPPPACPDFTGTYVVVGEDGYVIWTFNQAGCSSLIIERQHRYLGQDNGRSGEKLVLDGVFRSIQNSVSQISGRIRAGVFEMVRRTPVQVTRQGKPLPASEERYAFSRLPGGDLCLVAHWSQFEQTTRAVRLRGTGPAAERAAAERSDSGCGK